MADTMELSEKAAPPHETSKMSTFQGCVAEMLKQLADFGKELEFGDAALKMQIEIKAVDFQATSPARVYNSLQQHVSKLQTLSKSLKSVLEADTSASSSVDKACEDAVTSLPLKQQIASPVDPLSTDAAESKTDDVMVQIRAGKSEIERRISAFMERKQMEINENNVREFCNVIDCNQENSCARTDAVFTPYPGFKSHVKVTRVVNTYGPQTLIGSSQTEALGLQQQQHRGPAVPRDCGNTAIEERLQNIEAHLKLPSAGPVPLSVYQRIKKLEDRILELEGLSPEYFQSTSHLHKRPKMTPPQACSLTELDEKISAVKAALLKRASEYGPGYGPDCAL